MNKIFFSLLFFIALSVSAQVEYVHTLSKAEILASKENKTIMLVFSGSDWCVPCMRLDREILSQPAFENYASKKIVLLKADFPSRSKNKKHISKTQQAYNAKLFEKYNPKGIFPLVVMLNRKGEVIAETGYKKMTPMAYASYIDRLISTK